MQTNFRNENHIMNLHIFTQSYTLVVFQLSFTLSESVTTNNMKVNKWKVGTLRGTASFPLSLSLKPQITFCGGHSIFYCLLPLSHLTLISLSNAKYRSSHRIIQLLIYFVFVLVLVYI
jgi:hypothetical protein